MNFFSKLYFKIFLIISFTFLYCEYLIYYLVISQCSWPGMENEHEGSTIKSMFLADTHLLGPYKGHWFDKLRREWQMYRSFQSAVSLHEPEVVFILGDLFDEGQWCDDREFQNYIDRFFSLFKVPKNTQLYVVPGNHDIGFHYALRSDLVEKFEDVFKIFSVRFLNLKGNYFVLLNSMAMEGDGCYLCSDAEKELKRIAGELKCMRNVSCSERRENPLKYSRPILLQHFPMYRKSDANCSETDEAPPNLKYLQFREKWNCLSRKASEMIYNELNPRAILTGHVHHGCHTVHRGNIHEYTLSSFNWRNKNNPAFILANISPNKFSIEKCHLPRETTVIFLYCCATVGIILWILLVIRKHYKIKLI